MALQAKGTSSNGKPLGWFSSQEVGYRYQRLYMAKPACDAISVNSYPQVVLQLIKPALLELW